MTSRSSLQQAGLGTISSIDGMSSIMRGADSLETLAAFNKAVSEPLRLEVLRVLRNNSWGVLELSHILDVKQSALSHHLKILAQAGWVNTRREGNSIFYRRGACYRNPASHALQQVLLGQLDELPLSQELQVRIRHIQKERAASSKAFFQAQANNFEEQQERIATPAVYSKGLVDLLNNSGLEQYQSALEVGPGSGEFLSELAPRFEQVIALDNTEEMLQRAKQTSDELSLKNIQFVHGDTGDAVEQKIQADCIVLNMVLHHTPSPAELFDDLFMLLNPGGVLLITELCRHQQDWAKQACGDLWLGFEPEELLQWAQAAGFSSQQNVYQALRNGFQVQQHCFVKSSLLKTSFS